MYTGLEEVTSEEVGTSRKETTYRSGGTNEVEKEARMKLWRFFADRLNEHNRMLFLVIAPALMNVACIAYRFFLFNGSGATPTPYSYGDYMQVLVYAKLLTFVMYVTLLESKLATRNQELSHSTFRTMLPFGALLALLGCAEFFGLDGGNLFAMHMPGLLASNHLRLDSTPDHVVRRNEEPLAPGLGRLLRCFLPGGWGYPQRGAVLVAVVGMLMYLFGNPRITAVAGLWCLVVLVMGRVTREVSFSLTHQDRNSRTNVDTLGCLFCLGWLLLVHWMIPSDGGFMRVGFMMSTICAVLETSRTLLIHTCSALRQAEAESLSRPASSPSTGGDLDVLGSEFTNCLEILFVLIAWTPFAKADTAEGMVKAHNWIGYSLFAVSLVLLDLYMYRRRVKACAVDVPISSPSNFTHTATANWAPTSALNTALPSPGSVPSFPNTLPTTSLPSTSSSSLGSEDYKV